MEEAWIAIVFRLVVAFALSSVIALERQIARKVVPFGTYVLVCTGACLFVLVQIQMHYAGLDLGMAGGLAAGVGFLGSGAISSRGGAVQGFTTAATIWLMAAIGASVGAAMYHTAGAAFAMVLFVLMLDRALESLGWGAYVRTLRIAIGDPADVDRVMSALAPYRGDLLHAGWSREPAEMTLDVRVGVPRGKQAHVVDMLRSAVPGLRRASFE